MESLDTIVEVYDDNQPTGVEDEIEELDGAPRPQEPQRPWNPEAIRVNTKQFSLRNILDLIDDKDIELAPDFQRHQVWKKGAQKSRLIESILLQIPLPAFYFAEDRDGKFRVVDGLQRLSTIHQFVRGGADGKEGFALSDLEYLKDEEAKRFTDLVPVWQRRINNFQIHVNVIDPTAPDGVKYDIFKRINTGGTPLNSQEIRHCMSKKRSRDFLKQCAASAAFRRAVGPSMHDHPRMFDREMVLRFCAFRLLDDILEYRNEHGSMESLLAWATAALDDPETVSDEGLAGLAREFDAAMRNSYLVFEDHAFRKWPTDSERHSPINRALFESWSTALADEDPEWLRAARPEIVGLARKAMRDDPDYVDSITSSTGDPARVELRFEQVRQILRQARA